jgi:hypothetical protein
MTIEIVDLPIKSCDFHIVMLVYQRVFETTNQHVMSRFAGVFGHDLAVWLPSRGFNYPYLVFFNSPLSLLIGGALF